MMTDNSRNFKVYQASAGSGKTYTIVKEYLKLCLGSERQVDNFRHILAITFTNASANDMKAKIVGHLNEIIESERVEDKTMEADLLQELCITDAELKHNARLLLTHITHDYSSFCVSTIDAFVQKLSRTFAHDIGLPSQYTVSIDNDDVARTVASNIGLQISEDNPFMVRVLQDFSDNRFSNEKSLNLPMQLSDFIKKLLDEKAYQKDENNNIQDLKQYEQTLAFLKDKTKTFEQEVKTFVERFRAVEQQYGLSVEDYWQKKNGVGAFVNKLERKDFSKPNSYFYKALAERKCLSDKSKADANEALLAVLEPLNDFYEKEFGAYLFYQSQRELLYLYALRTKIRTEFERLAQEDEVVHISEFNKLLHTVMGDFSVPFVYERIGERFQHIFVDEFQDTSVLQWQNLIPLVDNGLSNNQMSMVVGDGKQSIYRFRSGEVEQLVQLPDIYALPTDEREAAFLQYQLNLQHNFWFHSLATNYRSFKNVVEFNNAFFESAYLQLTADLQKVYKDDNQANGKAVSIAQQPAKKDEGLVQIELYDVENQPQYSFGRIEEIVRDLTEHHGYRYEDIAILTRKTDLGSEIANYLNDKEIPVISQVSILLKSSAKVQLLVNTLRYLIHYDNEAIIANVMFYRRLTQLQPFDGFLDGLFDKVKAVASRTTAIEPELGLEETDAFAKAFSKATCLYDLCASLLRIYGLDTLRDDFVNYFMEEVFKYQSNLNEGINEFLDFWEQKQNLLAVKSISGNAVNIMTIHKSKGLQFNVVIYPEAITDLDEKLNKSKAEEEWLQPDELGFEPLPNLEKVMFKLDGDAESMGGVALQHVERERHYNQLDNMNLVYVAFTRPVQRLYVIAKQGKPEKPNLLRDFVVDAPIDLTPVDNNGQEADEVMIYRFGEADFRNPKEKQTNESEGKAMGDSVSSDWFHKIDVDSTPSMFWMEDKDPMLPREWGELVHQILSTVQTPSDMDSALSPYLLDGTLDAEVANMLKDKLMQMVQHPEIGEAFSSMAKVKNECDILFNGEIIRPDRYAELPEVIYLLDYKTGKKEEKYKTQIQRYAHALRELTDKEIRAYLVYLAETAIEVDTVSVG
jgi:ATP-dependent exoDNAse (exonuclease V) beta subunit